MVDLLPRDIQKPKPELALHPEKTETGNFDIKENEHSIESLPDAPNKKESAPVQAAEQDLPRRAAPAVAPVAKDQIQKAIEDILSAGLAEAYTSLPPERRQAFRQKGEEIAANVKKMVEDGRIKMRKVLHWIRSWLKMIPGVNHFFLEQEAKIKADQLLEYFKHHTGE